MVFNPDQPQVNAPNFLGFSRGQEADRSTSTLIKGATEAADSAIVGVERGIQTSIQNEVDDQIGGTRDAFLNEQLGVDPGVDELPSDAKSVLSSAERLSEARKRGKVSDTHYWAKMDDITRRLRHRYPGHKDAVDKAVSGMLGTTPANALRRAVEQERKEAERNARASNRFKQRALASGDLPDHVAANIENMTDNEVALELHKAQRFENNRRLKNLELTTQAAQNRLNDRALGIHVGNVASGVFSDIMNSVTGGKTFELITQARKNPEQLSNVEAQQLSSSISQLKSSAKAQLVQHLTERNPDGSSVAGAIGAKKLEDQIKVIDILFDSITQDIGNKNWNVVAAKTAMIEAKKNDASQEVLDNDVVRYVQAVESLPASFKESKSALNLLNQASTHVQTVVLISDAAKAYNSQATSLSAQLTAQGDRTTGKQKEALADNYIEASVDTGSSVENRTSLNKVLFSPSNDSYLNQQVPLSRRAEVFNKFTNPAYVASQQSLRDKGEVQNFNRWANFTERTFEGLVRPELESLKNVANVRKDVKLAFNPTTGLFEVKTRKTPNINKNAGVLGSVLSGQANPLLPSLSGLGILLESGLEKQDVDAVERLNGYISSMIPVWRLQGKNPAEQVARFIPEGDDTGPAAGTAIQSFTEGLFDALAPHLTPQEVEDLGRTLKQNAAL